MSFFPVDEPLPDASTDTAQPARQPWREPSQNELPAVIPFAEAIVTTPTVAIILSAVYAYSDGVEFVIDRRMRRHTMTTAQWRSTQADFSRHHGVFDTEGRIRWGMVLGDGEKLILDARRPVTADRPSTGHTVSMTGGGGGGSEFFVRFSDRLWLWPLPPEGPIEVVMQWPALGIPESRIVLDGTTLRDHATQAHPIWH